MKWKLGLYRVYIDYLDAFEGHAFRRSASVGWLRHSDGLSVLRNCIIASLPLFVQRTCQGCERVLCVVMNRTTGVSSMDRLGDQL